MKIHPKYNAGQAVYVTDASRAVGVVSNLLAEGGREEYVANIRAEYAKVAAAHARAEAEKVRLPIERARANREKIDWAAYQRSSQLHRHQGVRRLFAGRAGALHRLDALLPDLGAEGRFPAILEDEKLGEAARQLYADAQAMLKKIVDEKWFRPRAVIGFWPANAVGDDIRLFADGAAPSISRPSSRCASSSPSATAVRTWRCPTSSRRSTAASRIMSAASW